MGFLILASLIGMGFSAALLVFGDNDDRWPNLLASVLGGLLAALVIFVLLFIGLKSFDWTASKYKAEIINREYGTSYTRQEVFYAKDIIEIIQKKE
jgi:cytochrome c biogenesis protein CcdA